MNRITSFRLCTLSDEELLEKVDSLTDQMYQDGKIPSRNVPARPDADYDLLIGELLLRYKEAMEALQALVSEYNDPSVQMKTPIAYFKAFQKAEATITKAQNNQP